MDDLFTQSLLRIAAIIEPRFGPKAAVPTGWALFPVLFIMGLQSRHSQRDSSRIRSVGALCLYAITFFLLPSWCVTLAGVAVTAYILHHKTPGQRGNFALVFFLLMSLPLTPMLLDGFVRSTSASPYPVQGVASRALWLVTSLAGLIISIAPQRWPWIATTAVVLISTLRW